MHPLARCWVVLEATARAGRPVSIAQVVLQRKLVDRTTLSSVIRSIAKRTNRPDLRVDDLLDPVELVDPPGSELPRSGLIEIPVQTGQPSAKAVELPLPGAPRAPAR